MPNHQNYRHLQFVKLTLIYDKLIKKLLGELKRMYHFNTPSSPHMFVIINIKVKQHVNCRKTKPYNDLIYNNIDSFIL